MRCLALLLAMTAAAPAAGPEPRYRLEVGRELTYTGSALYEGENARFTESQIWTVWVLRQNPDGSVRLLVQNENRLTPEDRKGVPLDESTTDSSLAYVDLFADGRSAWNPTMGLMLDPVRLFPPLPRDADDLGKGWSRTLPDGELWTYKPAPDSGKATVYAAARTTPWDKVYGLSWKETLTDFRDQPVAVLGMNIDPNDNDAWFVVHALSLQHPTLKAQTLAASMNITACPATVVIDRDGKVAHIQIGYSRTRRDDLRKIISPLLKAPR